MIFTILIFSTIFHTFFTELIVIPIKSHKVLTKSLTTNQINSIYDNKVDTKGSFYSMQEKVSEVEFDLGNNFLIEYVIIKMKNENLIQNPIINVGNIFDGQGQLLYVCEISKEPEEFYKCQPFCRSNTVYSPGIISRKITLKLSVSTKWISIFEIQVFSRVAPISNDISSNRLVIPLDCQTQSWLLTNSTTNSSSPTNNQTTVYFEKSYIVTKLIVKFKQAPSKSFDIVMTNDRNQTKSVTISLFDCSLQHNLFTCTVNEKTFAARHLKITALGLVKLFIRGKTVFYPKLEINTSTNVNEKLQMTCHYSDCDRSVHGDCSPKAILTGVKFQCVNKRLLREPNGADKDSYVIINQGQVNPVWRSTRFSVENNSDSRMVVSMPRSYQYFGQYKCGCITADEFNTEILSESTQLSETDFLEELFFDKKFQYKLTDSDKDVFQYIPSNVLILSKSKIENTFFQLKITMLSLIQSNKVNVSFYTNERDLELSQIEKGTLHSMKAFGNISQSWSVETYRYDIDELFPDFIHGKNISIECASSNDLLRQIEIIRIIDRDLLVTRPAIWSNDVDSKIINMNILYANPSQANISYIGTECTGTSDMVITTVTKDSCQSFDRRLTCTNLGHATLVTFMEERNFAKSFILRSMETESKRIIDSTTSTSNTTLTQDDIVLKHQYTKLKKRSNRNYVTVELDFISKKINDFLLCGKVLVDIVIPNQPKKIMILQSSVINIDVELSQPKIDVLITVSIDNVLGRHVTSLQITDPTTFSPENVAFQQDESLRLFWDGIDNISGRLLQYYEVIIKNTVIACNHTVTDVIHGTKVEMTTNSMYRYAAHMPPVSRKHKSKLVVSVQPVYNDNMRGQIVKLEKESGSISQSGVLIKHADWRTELTITVVASQSELPCDIRDTSFNVAGINVEKFQWKATSLGNLQYKITNLVPGRKYQLTAKALYKYGPDDFTSRSYTFETADDVSVATQRHVAEINEYVNVTCVADIGPDDKFQKSVQWLRSDWSLLPDGVKSVASTSDRRVAYLVMEKASADYSGEYSCFAQPSASKGWMTVTIVVNDLVVYPTLIKMDFNEKSNKVVTTCSSSAVGDNDIKWFDPSGSIIDRENSSRYSIKNMITDLKVYKSILSMTNLSINNSGTYKCRKSIGNTGVAKEFFLYGNEKISIESLGNSSHYVGEKLRLRCSATPAIATQVVVWDLIMIDNREGVLMNRSYPNDRDKTVQDIELLNSLSIPKVNCRLLPVMSEPVVTSYSIKLISKVVVRGPTEVNSGENVTLTCLGYPDQTGMQLAWVFYSINKTIVGKEIINSGNNPNSKPYEPLRLDMNITDVKNTEAGRYACNFKQKFMTKAVQPSHSIELVVNSVNPFIIDIVKKDTHAPLASCYPIILLVSVMMSSFITYI